ncbi:dipeptide/oligopeptide/nickel ABC transporter permease/ATP-binding protein [Microbacterium album]|uniref:Dipeptide/oligopeptide/nickel ABC transporter ATP-binding protein n=1 Tax=Microbacterium album TaxID=2053191 RepID=A0A917IFH6_9MICO|nr:dipeptide/oligopeptide/nickel ABC transporter permease/ATP-binding protein [Microbacterium album]GGH48573.1 dipeptide/oligopeptide/nickel ABC transporter ATP-binding protein [Microbacterium album]
MVSSTVSLRVPTTDERPGRGLLGRLLSKPLSAISAGFLLLLVLAVIAAPMIAPYDPLAGDLSATFQLPSAAHPLGTDNLGRDILSRLMFAAGPALLNAAIAVATVLIVAVPTAVFAGYLRNWLDAAVVRTGEIVMAIPSIAVLLMVLAFFGQSMTWVMVALGLLSSPAVIRVVRSAAITVSEEPYIDAAKVAGLRTVSIVRRHILPRVIGTIVINLALIAAASLAVAAGLNFLGLGITPPEPSFGSMIAEGNTYLQRQPWIIVPPAVVLTLTVIAFILLGDGLRDALTEKWDGSRVAKPRVPAAVPAAVPPIAAQHATDAEIDDPVVRVTDLTIGYPSEASETGYIEVVSQVSFAVGRQETLGLVGESGCGKTTTSLAVLGLLSKGGEILNGTIEIDGVSTAKMSKAQRDALRGRTVAMISQEPMVALDPLYTVGNQLSEAIRRHTALRGAAVRQRMIELLEQVRINDPEKVARSYPFEISGGMAQRVAIAIALAGDPRLLIADEPTTALDVTVQAEILELLRTIQSERHMGLLLVTHNFGVVADLCDRVAVMKDGRIVELTDAETLFDDPQHDYTKLLLSSTLEESTLREPLDSEEPSNA